MKMKLQLANEIEQIEKKIVGDFRDYEKLSPPIEANLAALLKIRAELIADLDAALNATEGE